MKEFDSSQHAPFMMPGEVGEYDAVEADMDAANYHTLASRMNDLHKRAIKLGVVPPELSVLSKYERVTGTEDNQKAETRYKVMVMGGFPHLAGWHFVATIEPSESKEGGNMLYAVPGEDVPAEYRAATMDCDHCGTNRYRTQTFIVRHDDGRYAQVGRNCLADFLGSSMTPAQLARAAEFGMLLRQLVEGDPDALSDVGGKSQEWHVDTIGFVSTVAACARLYGFVTSKDAMEKAQAGEFAESTGRMAWHLEVDREARHEAEEAGFAVTGRDVELAKAAVYWGSQQTGDGDFAYNMRLVATSDAITWKQAGIAAYLVEGYRRDLEREVKERVARAAGAESQWLGEVGDRVHFSGTISYLREFTGNYGVTVLVKLVDQTGNVAATFTSGRWTKDLEQGQGLTLVGTIKKLDEYNGEKQTLLTRVKVEG